MNVVVVGSGIAGLTAALHADAAGHSVTVVTKDALGDGCTPLAQGGVAGVYGPGDSARQHAADTLTAGAGLSDSEAVAVLVRDGAARIAELIARGVAFDRDADGALLLGREAAHSHARIVHAGGDATGAAISRALAAATRASGVDVIEHAFVAEVLLAGGSARGIRVWRDGKDHDILADAVILATGGAGVLYAHTTNAIGTTGDGIAAALRAGAAVADLEFMQFHPTMLADGAPFLISEAVRGEGATLIDDDGRRFCFDAHPDGELAPRDVVARAIARRAAEQGSPVRLDATMLSANRLAERFPTIDRVTRERGFDWSSEPLPVTPAAHYLMGGIVTDLDGRSTLPGLLAVGETARTGVHGANRLASNSLLEGAVFGARAAAALAAGTTPSLGTPAALATPASPAFPSHFVPPPTRHTDTNCDRNTSPTPAPGNAPATGTTRVPSHFVPPPTHQTDTNCDRNTSPTPASDTNCDRSDERTAETTFSRAALQDLMWEHVGLLRDENGLTRALAQLDAWARHAAPARTRKEQEDANLLLLARAATAAALARTASVGAHHREDADLPTLIGA